MNPITQLKMKPFIFFLFLFSFSKYAWCQISPPLEVSIVTENILDEALIPQLDSLSESLSEEAFDALLEGEVHYFLAVTLEDVSMVDSLGVDILSASDSTILKSVKLSISSHSGASDFRMNGNTALIEIPELETLMNDCISSVKIVGTENEIEFITHHNSTENE